MNKTNKRQPTRVMVSGSHASVGGTVAGADFQRSGNGPRALLLCRPVLDGLATIRPWKPGSQSNEK